MKAKRGRMLRREGGLAAIPMSALSEITLRSGPPGSRMLPETAAGARLLMIHGLEVIVASMGSTSPLVEVSLLLASPRGPKKWFFFRLCFRQSVRYRRPGHIGRRRLSVGTAISRTAQLFCDAVAERLALRRIQLTRWLIPLAANDSSPLCSRKSIRRADDLGARGGVVHD